MTLGKRALAVLIAAASAAGCERFEQHEPQAARAPARPGREVRLSAEQAAAIGLATEPAAKRAVRETLEAVGWLVAVPGAEAVVKAPVAGFLSAPDGKTPFPLGRLVAKGRPMAVIHTFLSPQEQAQVVAAKEDADTVIRQSLASLEASRRQLDRLERDAKTVVSGVRLEQLRESAARAQAAYEESLEKLPFLPQEPYGASPRLPPVEIRAPIDGRCVLAHASPGQLVLQGDPLFVIADWSRLWVRARVFEEDAERVRRDGAAEVRVPGEAAPRQAKPVSWPLPTAAFRRTLDLFYELPNQDGRLRPGQTVSVQLPLGGDAQQVTIALSAVLWDGVDGPCVYVQSGEGAYVRRPVRLGPAAGGQVAVLEGVAEGELVVTRGAESLYGEAFRWQIPREDEDEDD